MSHPFSRSAPATAAPILQAIAAALAASAALATVPALAQDAPQGASGPPVAQTTPGAGAQAQSVGQLQEVVVTAEFRSENLQSTPLSITAITAADLQQQQLESVTDIGNVIPNAFFRQPVSNFGPTETIGLRGFNQTDFDFSFQPTVGVYVDDVYQGSLTGSSLDLADLSRVEVANGPQGTLFGMNSIGGALRLITNKPQDTNSASLDVAYGEKHRVEFVGIGNAVLIPEKLYARVVAVSRSEGSIGHYLDFTCEMQSIGAPASVYGTLPESISPLTHSNCAIGGLGGFNHQEIRGELRYLPTSRIELNANAYYYRQSDEQPLQTLLTPYGGPHDTFNNLYDSAVVFPKYNMHYAGNCGGASCNPYFVSPSPWDNYSTYGDVTTGQQFNPTQVLDEYGTSATLDWGLADHLHLKYIWAFRKYTTNWMNDSDLTPFGLTQSEYYPQEHRQFSNEIRLTGDVFNDRLEYTVGGFEYDARELEISSVQFGAYNVPFGPAFPYGLLPDFVNVQGFSTNNISGYAHLNFKLTDKWSITGGWRYSDQYQTEKYAHNSTAPGYSIVLPAPVVQSGRRGEWTGSINYQLTPTIFLYGEAASGSTLPGFNARIETIGQLEEPVPGQEAVNYEIGAKTDWFDHRLRVNGTLFYEDYKSYLNLEIAAQCSAATSLDPGKPYFLSGGLCPAGTDLAGTPGLSPWFYYTGIPAYMPGAELEVYAEPIDRLLFNFEGGWIRFHDKISDPTSPGYIDPSVRLQPEWSASAGLQYGIAFPNGARLTPRLDWVYQGYMTNGAENIDQVAPNFIVPGYSLFNASLTYAPDGDKWDVSLQALNAFNKFYWQQLGAASSLINAGAAPTASNFYTPVGRVGTPGSPREWMIRLRWNL
ncbi:MAG: TonB-dependent receptor [Steroidobacteraceae bacterium]